MARKQARRQEGKEWIGDRSPEGERETARLVSSLVVAPTCGGAVGEVGLGGVGGLAGDGRQRGQPLARLAAAAAAAAPGQAGRAPAQHGEGLLRLAQLKHICSLSHRVTQPV